MFLKKISLVGVIIALPLILWAGLAFAVEKTSSSPINSVTYTLAQLTGGAEIVLKGVSATYSLFPTHPKSWDVQEINLHLNTVYSPVLDRNSSLTVAINNVPLDTILLAPEQSKNRVLDITIPRKLLNETANTVTLDAFMRITKDICQDMENAGNWLRVTADSTITYKYILLPFKPNLSNFPYPFVDKLNLLADEVVLVLPAQTTAEQITPAFNLAKTLGSYASWRGLNFIIKDISALTKDDLNKNLVFIGDFSHLAFPANKNFPLPLARNSTGQFVLPSGELTPQGTGIIMLAQSPWNFAKGVMVLTGASNAAVNNAALSLNHPEYLQTIAVTNYALASDQFVAQMLARDVTKAAVFTLKNLGYPSNTIFGLGQNSMSFIINLPFDKSPKTLQINTEISHAPFVAPDRSYAMLSVNGVPQDGTFLTPENQTHAQWLTTIAGSDLQPGKNTIEYLFDLYLNQNQCTRMQLTKAWVTVYDNTAFKLTYTAEKPVVGLNQFPAPLGPNTKVVISKQASFVEQESAILLGGLFGSAGGESVDRIELADSSLSQHSLAQDDFVLLGLANNQLMTTALTNTPVQIKNGNLVVSKPNSKIQGLSVASVIYATASPWNKQKSMMVIVAQNTQALQHAMKYLLNPALRSQLVNNIAVFDNEGQLIPFNVNVNKPWRVMEEKFTALTSFHIVYVVAAAILLVLLITLITIYLAVRRKRNA